ncbi:protein-disulfide reductase DsbD [Pseudoxanthomonas sp. SGNA-20]|uniref:protein-disulfide reductase DsbD family protein n=2 Tax=unclassified Pseudoxanthomonas TaxID=2645906 RepID=UPI0021019898|nr:protein-disulfide reductase DsbD [Pseudoxanthomonas sp. SGNA-20]
MTPHRPLPARHLPGLLLMLLAWLAVLAPVQAAVDAKDLLPVDEAFVLTATAPEPGRIEIHWKIAEGYYLYRHRTAVSASGDFVGGNLRLPAGERHVDEFFGPVETYRGALVAILDGQPTGAGASAELQIRYQGCADIGICYPPQTRRVQVRLPGTSTAASRLAALQSANAGRDRLATALGGVRPALPEAQAFAVDAIADGGNRIRVRLQPVAGYYIYRDTTRFVLEDAPGLSAGRPQWSPGTAHRDEHFGEVTVYFEPAEVVLPVVRTRPHPARATLVVTFQGCQEGGICYPPMTRRVAVDLPTGEVTTAAAVGAAPLPPAPAADAGEVAPAELPAPPEAAPDASAGNAARTAAPPAAAGNGKRGLVGALLLALLGGLVLNLMPCVLPVLSLKALGLAQSGESRERARAHALWYTAGVLVAFAAVGALVVGLRAAGQAAGWGFQLQQPWFVAALAYLMFAVGLSLSGVYTLGTGVGGGLAAARNGPAGDFLTGVLACVVASPCIAPFMGPALAYAFAAPAAAGMLVFLVLGLGLALPFLLVGFVPALARRLPQPGPWMETVKQLLAYPMYLTAVWLLWILGRQRGVDAVAMVLAGAAVLALALWWFERSRWWGRRGATLAALVLVAVALAPVWGVTRLPPASVRAADSDAVPYSAAELDRLRGENRVVFVNMTADWCVTCKANERNVLARDGFRELLGRTGAVYMRGDWTNTDPAISAFLEAHNAVGVPLYVVYGPGAPPAVLPPVLTPAIVEDALLRAAAR